jgi:cytoskeletal protein RodZ
VAAIVLGVLLVAFVFVSQLFADNLGLDAAQSAKLDGRALIGAQVIGPVTVVGVAVTLVGVWMAATEWRGRFAAPTEATDEREIADPTKIVEALGKLRGAALVLVSGVVILLGVAWMTSATASAPPAPTPSSTSTSTANPTT